MPKEKVHVKRYDGVIGVTDAHDLPEGAAYYAENLDIVTQDASFVGLPEDETYTGNHAGGAEIELFEDGNTGVSYNGSSGDVKIISFNHDTKTVTAPKTSGQASGKTPAMASSGQAIHIGMGGTSASSDKPLWAGKVYHEQADMSGGNSNQTVNAGDYVITDAEITSEAFGYCINSSNTYRDKVFIGLPPAGNSASLLATNRYDSGNANLRVGRAYRYYASAVYDGSQEAPLSLLLEVRVHQNGIFLKSPTAFATEDDPSDYREVNGSTNGDHLYISPFRPVYNSSAKLFDETAWKIAVGSESSTNSASVPAEGIQEFGFFLSVRIADGTPNGLPALNRRVSGVKIYRSEVFQDDTGRNNESEPSFVKYYGLKNESGVTTWFTETMGSGDFEVFAEDGDYIYLWVLDSYPSSYTFEQNTGYAATLENMELHWATSCVSNAYHIIGNCWGRELEDVDTWLFRSKPFRYNTFDWSRDYLVLPSKPTALVSYGGRVYAFSASRVYVIDPIAFDIEDTWEGVGCDSEKSIVSTESGLFWASRTGIYQFIANEVVPIGLPVNRLHKPPVRERGQAQKVDVGWLNHDKAFTPVCAYSPVHNALLVMYRYQSTIGTSSLPINAAAGLMYHVPTGRWAPFSIDQGLMFNAHTNSRGDVMIGLSTGQFKRMFTADTYRRWRFVSRQYGEKGAIHKYYHAYISTSDINTTIGEVPGFYYYKNDSAYTDPIPAHNLSTLDDNQYLHKVELTENGDQGWDECRTFAFELRDTGKVGGSDCSDVTIIRRRINPR